MLFLSQAAYNTYKMIRNLLVKMSMSYNRAEEIKICTVSFTLMFQVHEYKRGPVL